MPRADKCLTVTYYASDADDGHLSGQGDFISEWDYYETAIILSWIIDHHTVHKKKKTHQKNNKKQMW